MITTINIEDYWKNHLDSTGVVQFYIEDISEHDEIKESFSYIYDTETDEVEFSFIMGEGSAEVPIYYTSNDRKFRMERGVDSKFIVATITVSSNEATSTVIARIPAYGKLIRELYEENKSPVGLISPGDYNPTLGSNFYKDSNDNSYVTKDTFEDYVRSSNIEGHFLDEVGRKQLYNDRGYYKIIKSLKIKCNALEKTVDSEGNYYSADRSTNSYLVYGIYTYDLYDSDKNLLIEGVSEVTSHITIVNSTQNKYVGIGKLTVPVVENFQSYNYTYVGHLYYEDFDGIIQTVQSDNHIILERFISAEFGIEEGTPKYYEGGYPLYIVGPYVGNSITFSVQVEGTINGENQVVYPDGDQLTYNFSNPQYSQYFKFIEDKCSYNSTTGKIKVTIAALSDNNEDDPFRPSYAKILPSLERTTFKIYKKRQLVESLEASYYIIQKSAKIGIIPKKYESRDSTTPIDLPIENGKYILTVTGGVGIKIAFLGITSEVDPYDKNIVRNWTIRENMDFSSVYSEDESTESNKILERQYFFENYSGALQEKIVFITGAYDGTLAEFYIRDYIDRSDIWRRAIYESEITIIPKIDNTDRTVDLGGNWTYTLDTSTNYFIGSDLLYLFNENNRYYTQRFNLDFTFPPNSGPRYDNFKASIDDFGVTGPGSRREEEPYTSEEGITYTYYSSPRSIYLKLFGDADTYQELKDRNNEGKWEKIEIKRDDLKYISLSRFYSDDENSQLPMYISTSSEPTECPIKNDQGQIITYLKLTTVDTGYPAFNESNGKYIRYTAEDESPLYFMLTTTNTGCAVKDKEGHQVMNESDEPLFFDFTTNSTGYPAYRVIYEGYVDKYQSLVSIKYSRDKQIYFAYEGMESKDKKEDGEETRKTVKFDILYPQESKITTKDILRIPTINPLKFVFKLSGTTASYEMQEIRFYCGIEGIQPLELLSKTNKKIPDPEVAYADYPDIELISESNKFEVICQTQNDLYPDWRVTSANNTFNYSAPKGNTVEYYNEETSLNFDESKSYLQIDLKNNLGGSDIIDFTRVKNGVASENWWNDWRFFIYNKFLNRFNVVCSSGSPELLIQDASGGTINSITFDKIGLYRIHISIPSESNNSSEKTLAINIPTGVELYQVENLQFYNSEPDKLLKDPENPIRRGEKFPNSQYIQIDTNSSGTSQTSFVLYLWYEGSNIKIDKAKFYFQLTIGSGENERILSKYILVNQTNSSNLNDISENGLNQFFNLSAYKFDENGEEELIPNLPNQPINDFHLGFPIFNGRPGRIVLTNNNTNFPYKLKYDINKGSTDFIQIDTELKIDSPLTSANYNNGSTLTENGCYIEGSFINYSYNIKPKSYGIGYRDEDSDISNQSTKSWELSFMDSRNNNNLGILYYYSPIDLEKFELRSPSAKYGKIILGRNEIDDFLVNAGYEPNSEDRQDDNFLSEENRNTVFYDYGGTNTYGITLYHPNLQNDRLSIIDDPSSLDVQFVTRALNDDGEIISASIESTKLNNSLFLEDTYQAISWSKTSKTSFNITLYTDSSVGSNNYTNIPLELLNQFGNNLEDSAKSVGWITTMIMNLNLKVLKPTEMDENLFNTLVINSDDPTYPESSQYYGLGQEFINKITQIGDEVLANTLDGKTSDGGEGRYGKNNPRFIIPLSWFKNDSSHNYQHTIRIKVDASPSTFNQHISMISENHRDSINKDLMFGAELYEKDSSKSDQLGETINGVQFINSNVDDIEIQFDKEVTTDIVLVPKFTNIEYNYFNGMETSNNPDIFEYNKIWDSSRIETFKKITRSGGTNNYTEANIQTSNKTFSTTTNSEVFLGLKIEEERDNRMYLNTSSEPNPDSSIGIGLKNIINGFPVDLRFWVDNDQSRPNAVVESIKRLGYQCAALIQPGKFYKYIPQGQNYETATNTYFKIWYSFRPSQSSGPGNGFDWSRESDGGLVEEGVDNGNYLKREIYILFPGRNDTLYMNLERKVGDGPLPSDFYRKEWKIQVLTLNGLLHPDVFRPTDTTSGMNQFAVDPVVMEKEDYHTIMRISQTNNSTNTNNTNTNSIGVETSASWIVDLGEGEVRPENIEGPYPVEYFSNGAGGDYCTIGLYKIQFRG